MKLRLLLWSTCNRRCKGCCNKEWDLASLPVCKDYTGYSEIMLTGGEPLLYPEKVLKVISDIRKVTDVPIYLYTAKSTDQKGFLAVLDKIDGVCLTLHTQNDVAPFVYLDQLIGNRYKKKSLRLNIFDKIHIDPFWTKHWKVKDHMKWIVNCPLPTNEVFMKLDVDK